MSSDDDDDDFSPFPGKKASKPKQRFQVDSDDDSDQFSPDVDNAKKTSSKPKTRNIDDSDEEFVLDVLASSVKNKNLQTDDREDESDGVVDDSNDDDFIASSGDDFESPVRVVKPRTKTPRTLKKTVKSSVSEEEEEDSVIIEEFETLPEGAAAAKKNSTKNVDEYKFEKLILEPFDEGQKFTKKDVGALETRLAAVRKSIERVITA